MAYRICGIDEPERVLSMLDDMSDSRSELEEEDDIDRDLDGDISAMADMPVGVRFAESSEGTSAADGNRLSNLGSRLHPQVLNSPNPHDSHSDSSNNSPISRGRPLVRSPPTRGGRSRSTVAIHGRATRRGRPRVYICGGSVWGRAGNTNRSRSPLRFRGSEFIWQQVENERHWRNFVER